MKVGGRLQESFRIVCAHQRIKSLIAEVFLIAENSVVMYENYWLDLSTFPSRFNECVEGGR